MILVTEWFGFQNKPFVISVDSRLVERPVKAGLATNREYITDKNVKKDFSNERKKTDWVRLCRSV